MPRDGGSYMSVRSSKQRMLAAWVDSLELRLPPSFHKSSAVTVSKLSRDARTLRPSEYHRHRMVSCGMVCIVLLSDASYE